MTRGGAPRAGISITLQLSTEPHLASLSGTDHGHLGRRRVGELRVAGRSGHHQQARARLRDHADGLGGAGTASGEFGIYREGEPCPAGQTCVVHDNISDPKLGASVTSSTPGDLGVLVLPSTINCSGYNELSDDGDRLEVHRDRVPRS